MSQNKLTMSLLLVMVAFHLCPLPARGGGANDGVARSVPDLDVVPELVDALKAVIDRPDDAGIVNSALEIKRQTFKGPKAERFYKVIVACMVQAFGESPEQLDPMIEQRTYQLITGRFFLDQTAVLKELIPLMNQENMTARKGVGCILRAGRMISVSARRMSQPAVFTVVRDTAVAPKDMPYLLLNLMFNRNAEAAAETLEAPDSLFDKSAEIVATLRLANKDIAEERLASLRSQVRQLANDSNWVVRMYAIGVAREMVFLKLIKSVNEVLPLVDLQSDSNANVAKYASEVAEGISDK